ncbi:MAG: tail fiber domain-containing protein [Bacteroidia bacterium]|nr:tail fiber domain-containing protein [Bacteroidia bacterium]
MKNRIFFFALIGAFPVLSATAQLKVDQYGRIGMGTNYPNPEFKCHVAGNLLLTTYPASPSYEMRMKVGINTGVNIGSSSDLLSVWTDWVSYNNVLASGYLTASDESLKSEIKPVQNGLQKVLGLRPVHYRIEDNKLDESGKLVERTKPAYGFISQEVEKQLPEVKITEDQHDIKLMDYNQIIPLTVSAIQQQQDLIDSLKKELQELREQCAQSGNAAIPSQLQSRSVLQQNVPNPFTERTVIGYTIAEEGFRSASLMIFDMNGSLLKQQAIPKAGKGEWILNGQELKAGMYIYSLIVNDQEADTKRMILVRP